MLPRHAKLKFDETRQVWVILAPERCWRRTRSRSRSCSSATASAMSATSSTQLAGEIRRAARHDPGRRDRHAAGSRRQGLPHRSPGEDVMSDLLGDHPARQQRRPRRAGEATLDRGDLRHSARRAAELTHRCPLQCPYCSNPVELERAGKRADHRGMEEGPRRARRDRRAADAFLRRRADGAQGPRRAGRGTRATPASTPT